MARILFIIAQKGFRDEELFEPKDILKVKGHSCKVASITRKECVGKLNAKVKPDMAVSEVDPHEFDVYVVVGGPGAPELINHPEVIELLRTAKILKKIIAAICIGPMVLAYAGVLEGKRATVFPAPEALDMFRKNKVTYVNEDIVVDGNFITAPGPKQATIFGNKLVEILKA